MSRRIAAFLAVGHGITPTGADDPGAVCAKNGKAVKEANEALKVTQYAVKELIARGFQVRSEVSLANRDHDPNHVGSVARALNIDPYISIEVHFDWQGAPRGGFPLVNEGRLLSRRLGDRILAQPLRYVLGVGHRLYTTGIDGLHLCDQLKNTGQLRARGFDFLFVHRQPRQPGDFPDICISQGHGKDFIDIRLIEYHTRHY